LVLEVQQVVERQIQWVRVVRRRDVRVHVSVAGDG
jgi:hypothetical protein